MNHLTVQIKSKLRSLNLGPQFSLSMVILKKNKKVFSCNFGQKKDFYDLASMTKSIFTGLYFLEKNLYTKKVVHFLPWVKDKNITIGDLLSHTSGLEAHQNFYLDLVKIENREEKKFYYKKLLQYETENTRCKKPNYSDTGYLLLGEVIKEIELNDDLNLTFKRLREQYKLSESLHFNFNNKPKYSKNSYTPTEHCRWRKKIIQGQVFDDNAYALGGVATHAGLFGSIESMIDFGKVLSQVYFKNPKKFKKACDGWTHGFMLPSGPKSTAGVYFSEKSIGHLGFTGTSFWFDPQSELYVSILSNRTYPNRNNSSFNLFRPWVHDLLFKEFVNESAKPRSL